MYDRTIKGLKEDEIDVLQKGLNYNITYKNIPKDEIAIKLQTATHTLSDIDKRRANAEIANILSKS